ncbi:C6 zinc finger domain protein [Cryphonectria parasitica EP155]|uniref:C6 zinc finger domain protein n=1 Tax=Cryphonectria parasitica (strain ATCC 38755 / EP155) TaxID=660469 RepID=A0A9P4XU98_CRYP1|nr:C6 zinc finger domain protein [Cryphonectria parasitica EP155]KAF3760870.1 C6 zinc finger domain protein [Cryphonectria parasitica EP155]
MGLKEACWECLRRQVACDATHPICNTCIKNGVVCPGYEDQRPLRWLAPGTVKSRTGRKPKRPNVSTKQQPKETQGGVEGGSSLSLVVLTTELDPIVEAVKFWNEVALPEYRAIGELAPNPWLTSVPMDTIRLLPTPIVETVVFMAIGYRISQFPEAADRSETAVLRTRMYHHRGRAVKTISLALSNDKLRDTDYALAIVLMLLFGESRQCASSTWAHHFEGACKMIALRGGLLTFADNLSLRPVLEYFLIIGVMANTISPASRQLAMTRKSSNVDTIAKFYGDDLFPVLFCPPELFLEVIRINDLRARACALGVADLPDLIPTANEILDRILSFQSQSWADVHKGSSVDGRDHSATWILLASVYQSAIALYCVSSLQSLSVLPYSTDLENLRSEHREILGSSLAVALRSPQLKFWMMWPVVVAGLEAGPSDTYRDGGNVCEFVSRELRTMAKYLGTPLPLVARDRLQAFWGRPDRGWDDCFEQPFAFVT